MRVTKRILIEQSDRTKRRKINFDEKADKKNQSNSKSQICTFFVLRSVNYLISSPVDTVILGYILIDDVTAEVIRRRV